MMAVCFKRSGSVPARRLASALHAALLASAGVGGVAVVATPAAAQQGRTYDIAAGTLADALNDFAEQSGVVLVYDSALVSQLRSGGLKGSFDTASALSRLLARTGLTFRQTAARTYTLEPAPRSGDGAISLGPVRVQGEGTATGGGSARPPADTRDAYTVPVTSSATRLDLAIKDTPQVVHVITRQRIEDQNLVTVSDVMAQTPGVTVQQQGVPGAGRIEYWSRGFPITNVMLDGVTTTGAATRDFDLWGALDSAIYDRVEFVQGSTGLMTGAGDPSGTVNFVRKRPTETMLAELRFSHGSWGRVRAEADLSGSLLGDGAVRGRVVGAYQYGDSWQDRLSHRTATVYGVVEADVTDRVMLSAGVLWTKIRVDDAVPFGFVQAVDQPNTNPDCYSPACSNAYALDVHDVMGRNFNPATSWSFSEIKLLNPFARLEWRVADNWRLNVNYMYSDIHHERLYGAMGLSYWYVPTELVFDIPTGIASWQSGHVNLKGQIHNLDVSVSGRFALFGRENEVVAGFSGYWGKARSPGYLPGYSPYYTGTIMDPTAIPIDRWNNGNVPMPTLGMPELPIDDVLNVPTSFANMRERQLAGYFGLRLRPTDWLSVIAGGRINEWKRASRGELIDIASAFFPPYDLAYLPDEFSSYSHRIKGSFTPYAGLVFSVTDKVTLYGSFARSEKATIDWERGHWFEDRFGNALPPIKADTYEIGAKAALFDGRMNIQLAAYRMEQTNNPVVDPDPSASPCVHNPLGGWCSAAMISGDVGIISKGLDFSASGALGSRINLTVSWSYLEQTYEGIDALTGERRSIAYCYHAYADAGISRTGRAGFQCPRHTVKAFATYRATDAFTIGGGLTWKSATQGNDLNGLEGLPDLDPDDMAVYNLRNRPAFTVVDVMARYQITPRLTVSANVNNLFNEDYVVSSEGGSSMGTFFGAPRNVMVSLGFRY